MGALFQHLGLITDTQPGPKGATYFAAPTGCVGWVLPREGRRVSHHPGSGTHMDALAAASGITARLSALERVFGTIHAPAVQVLRDRGRLYDAIRTVYVPRRWKLIARLLATRTPASIDTPRCPTHD